MPFPNILIPWQRHLAGLSLMFLIFPAQANEILIITDSKHPVSNSINTNLIELDRPEKIKAKVSSQLPADPVKSTALAKERLFKDGAPKQLGAAYQDIVNAWQLGITKIPAVVVDQRYVVYGEPDVIKAVALIEAYRRSQP